MGCSQSRLNNEEAVQLCKDRKRYIRQAVEQITQFASGHKAYIQSLNKVSVALREYIEGDESYEFSLDSFMTPPFTPVKKIITDFGPNSTLKVNYLRAGGNAAISVEERPQSPEIVRVETYSPMHQFGEDGFFAMQASPMNSSTFAYSPNNRPNISPPSPQSSQWDSFWNPFSSLDYYGYPIRNSLDHSVMDGETEKEDFVRKGDVAEEKAKIDINFSKEEVTVEDVDQEKEKEEKERDAKSETKHKVHGNESFQVSKAKTAGEIESSHQEVEIGNQEDKEKTPGFTVYVNQRPTSMAEVIRDLEAQFSIVCHAANDFSALLAKKAQHLSPSNALSAANLLNPVAMFHSASSRFSSPTILMNYSSTRDDGYKGTDDPSEEHCMFSGSHQSTLDRLYEWEKKLYEEVKSGARVRIAYEKKCLQLRSHDVKEKDPTSVKTRAAIRNLETQLMVSIQSVESISSRIETLRDEELHPQLLELVQGLARMWKVMAECHNTQKRALDKAKILLTSTYSKLDFRKESSMSRTDPQRLARSATNLETELRNWQNTFASWITSQRSYINALTGWLLRCMRSEPDVSKLPWSPCWSSSAQPLIGLCVQWSRRLDAIDETTVIDGMEFFAIGVRSLYAQQLREESHQNSVGSKEPNGNMEKVEIVKVEEVMTTQKMAEIGIKVLCAGMSVAMSSLAEFATDFAEGYTELVKQWENMKCQH